MDWSKPVKSLAAIPELWWLFGFSARPLLLEGRVDLCAANSGIALVRRHQRTVSRFRLLRSLNLQIDADHLFPAIFSDHPRALAEFCEAEVGILAKFQSRGD